MLSAWARVWEVPNIIPHKRTDLKLQRWVDKDQSMGYNILKTLAIISNMFADVRDLEGKYGLHLKQRDAVRRAILTRRLASDSLGTETS